MLNSDRPIAEQLALMGPNAGSRGRLATSREPEPEESQEPKHEDMNGAERVTVVTTKP